MQLHSLLTYSSIAIRLQQNSKTFNKPDVANERLRPLFGSGIDGFMQHFQLQSHHRDVDNGGQGGGSASQSSSKAVPVGGFLLHRNMCAALYSENPT